MWLRSVFGVGVALSVVLGCGPATAPSSEAPASAPPGVASAAAATPSVTPAPATPSPSPVAEATVPVDWATYTSERYAYAIDYPTDWIATPASQDWSADGFSYPDDPAIDKWVMPGATGNGWVLMFVSSVPLKAGESAKERIARLDSDNATQCQLADRRDATLAGEPARQEEGTCFGTDFISDVAAVHGDRFYLLYILSGAPITAVGHATFDQFLSSFHFGAS